MQGKQLDSIRSRLLGLLQEHDVLPRDLPAGVWRTNLFDHGLVDSMGAVHMLEMISETFAVEIDPDLLVGQLTTLDAICAHIADRQPRD